MKVVEKKTDSEEDKIEHDRGHWKRPVEFVLSLIGFSVGMGSIWRFPYLAMRNGGGAFLIPYVIFAVFVAIPVVSMETAFGQYFQLSPLLVFDMCPLFKGLGISITILAFIGYIYYMVILAWSLYFLVMSFVPVLPWTTCGNAWNTNSCLPLTKDTSDNLTISNWTTSSANTSLSTEEFWRWNVLDKSSGIDDIGEIRWQLLVAIIVSFALVYVCIFKGIDSSRIAVYFTATAPFVILIILLGWLLTRPGSSDGLLYFLTPRWEEVTKFQTWLEAFLHVFYSVGSGWGALINLSSYSPFHHDCLRDSILVVVADTFTAILCGTVVFSGIGCIAYQTNTKVADAITTGPGLSFVTYPQVVASMPVPHLWAISFFLLILLLGLDSQFSMVKTVTTGITDLYPRIFKRYQPLLVFVILVISLLLSLPFITQGGIYMFQIVDWYFSFLTILVVAICESLVIGWLYGADKFLSNIREMGTFASNWYLQFLKISIMFVIPLLMFSALILAVVQFRSPTYGDYEYPAWTNIFGWILALSSSLPIPVVMLYKILTTPGTLKQRLTTCIQPVIGKKGGRLDEYSTELDDVNLEEKTQTLL